MKSEELKRQHPGTKYNNLKPWQIEINESIPPKLIHKNNLDIIKKYFETQKFNDRELNYYLSLARNYPKTELYLKGLIAKNEYNT